MEDFPSGTLLLGLAFLIAASQFYFTGGGSKKTTSTVRQQQQQQHSSSMKPTSFQSVGIVGAGSIGSVTGLSLAKNGNIKVVLVGTQSITEAVEANNGQLRLRDKSRRGESGHSSEIISFDARISNSLPTTKTGQDSSGVVTVTENLQGLLDFQCAVIIVATKSTATKAVGEGLAKKLPKDSNATILSFQNGIGNDTILREALKGHTNLKVFSAMVNFNASWEVGTNLFNKNTDGGFKIERPKIRDVHSSRVDELVAALTENHVASKAVADVSPDMYSKLLINLFNPINALSGLSTPAALEKAGYRRVWSAAISEGLAIYQKRGIKTTTFRGLPPSLLPWMTVLPDSLFWLVLRRMSRMDDSAKASMLQDWERGRATTEIDYLAGEIVRLGREANMEAPVNAALVRLVKAAEAAGKGSPGMSPEQLLVEVGLEEEKNIG